MIWTLRSSSYRTRGHLAYFVCYAYLLLLLVRAFPFCIQCALVLRFYNGVDNGSFQRCKLRSNSLTVNVGVDPSDDHGATGEWNPPDFESSLSKH